MRRPRARWPSARARSGPSSTTDRCARGLFRAGAALPDHGQRAPRPALPAVRRRRARHAGADHRAHGAQARHQHHRARLHRRRQRPGALRGRAAHAGAGPQGAGAGARPGLPARGRARLSAAAQGCRCRPAARAYSVNRGLWGVTIGGKETLTSAGSIPDEAWVLIARCLPRAARGRSATRQLPRGPARRPSMARRCSGGS